MKNVNVGDKIKMLTVLEYPKGDKCVCLCECGNIKEYYKSNLGKTISCGCYGNRKASERFSAYNKNRKCLRESHTRLYRIWCGMKTRCDNSNNHNYKGYGDKGITYCKEWKEYDRFRNWALKSGYEENLTLDRIDSSLNYEPSNCRWITNAEQQRNKRTNVKITYNGETHCMKEWSEILNIPYHRFRSYRRDKKSLIELISEGVEFMKVGDAEE